MRKLLPSNLLRRLNQTLGGAAAPKSTAQTLTLFSSAASPPPPPPPHLLLLRRFRSWRPPTHHRGRLLLPPAETLGFLSGNILFNRAAAAAAAAAAARSSVSRSSAWLEIRSLFVSLQRRSGAGHLFSSIRRSWTYWIQSPDGVVRFLIGTNIAVFFLWRIADPLFMRKHFMISLDNFRSGRLHTLLTSAFSHSDLDHLVTNMIGLYFFGSSIANLFGPQFLLKLYLAGALTGSVFFLVHKAFLVPPKASYRGWDDSRVYALGASAAVNAIILLEVFLFPKRLVYLYFVVPVPAMLVGALLIGSDLWRIKTGQGHVSGSGHLGGAFVAALVWARIRKGWI